MRAPVFLVVGLVAGIAGAVLFQQSFPPPAGSVEEKLDGLERELDRTRVLLAAAEARAPRPEASTQQKFSRGVRSILEEWKAGREVDLEEFYMAMRPAMRDLSPLFERMKKRELRKQHEFVLQELTRKYKLTPAQQAVVQAWQKKKIESDVAAYRELNANDNVSFIEMIKGSSLPRPTDGLDEVMAQTLTEPERTRYQKERMNERLNQVQAEADRRVTRLHDMVGLDDAQQDQVFALMARSSRDFDPSMQFEGLSADTTPLPPGESRDQAIRALLRPEQRQKYEEKSLTRRIEAEKDLREMGLKIPANWDMLADD
jgi:hypothetical protein